MTPEFIIGAQFFADIVLCLALIFLVRAVNREIKKRPPGMDKKTFAEFSALIEASRRSTDDLLRALNDVKQIGHALGNKKKETDPPAKGHGFATKNPEPETLSRGEKYKTVIRMSQQGLSGTAIAEALALTVGEIRLILDLHRKKNETSVSGNNISKN